MQKPTTSNQRLVLIETSYGSGILFDQKDTVQAYQLLCRATLVSTGGMITPNTKEDIDIKLISPTRLMTVAEYEEYIRPSDPAPDMPAAPAPQSELSATSTDF